MYCLYKGDCVYYLIFVGGECLINVVWMYEYLNLVVELICGYFVFYLDCVDLIEECLFVSE